MCNFANYCQIPLLSTIHTKIPAVNERISFPITFPKEFVVNNGISQYSFDLNLSYYGWDWASFIWVRFICNFPMIFLFISLFHFSIAVLVFLFSIFIFLFYPWKVMTSLFLEALFMSEILILYYKSCKYFSKLIF